jgi:CheY-like chemotaxis protein/two-component sensor histidine kinase
VDDLLELTRITQNKIKLKRENINLNEIVYGSIEDIRPEFEKKGVTFRTRIQSSPVLLNADPVRINQIIGNILFNALKFTQEKGTVWVTLKTTKDDAVIRVKDNGIGISPEILPHLFSPFTQADHSLDRSTGGLGLGLSIVKGIVDLHGGKVSAFSEGLGKGSTFEIRLPLNNDEGTKKLEIMPAEKKNRSLKILLIDDNQDFTDILSSALTLLGHEVITANDGMTGIAKSRDYSPEVIFCDIGLPDMDGFEVAKRIRGEVSIQNVYMVALTGYANQSDTDKALESGFNKHLAKPVDINTIRKVLNEIGS